MVISIKETIMAINKDSNGFITFSTLVLASPIPTNRIEPKGGVHKPIHKFKTIMIPN